MPPYNLLLSDSFAQIIERDEFTTPLYKLLEVRVHIDVRPAVFSPRNLRLHSGGYVSYIFVERFGRFLMSLLYFLLMLSQIIVRDVPASKCC